MKIKHFFILITILIIVIKVGIGQNDFFDRNNTLNDLEGKKDSYGLGKELYSQKKYPEALDAFNLSLEIDPKNISVWRWEAYTLDQLGNSAQALDALNMALRIDPKNEKTWEWKAYILEKTGNHTGALDAYDIFMNLNNSPGSLRKAWYSKGTIFEKMKRYDDAIDAYDCSIKNDTEKKSKKAYYNKGNLLYKKMDYKNSLVSYSEAISLDPEYIKAIFNQGNAFYMQNMYKEAAEAYIHASRLLNSSSPNESDKYIWNNRGAAQRKLGNFGDALFSFSRAIEIDQNYSDSLYSKALVLAQLGKYNDSIEFFNKTAEIDPNDEKAFSGKGLALSSLGRYEEAIEAYKQAIKVNESYEAAWSGKGIALEKIDKDIDALISLKRAVILTGRNSSNNLYLMGQILYKLNCFDEALRSYRDARDIELLQNHGLIKQCVISILLLFIVIGTVYIRARKCKPMTDKALLLLNLTGTIAFFWIISGFLGADMRWQFVLIGLSIIFISAILISVVDSRKGTYVLRFKLAFCEMDNEGYSSYLRGFCYGLSIIYALIILGVSGCHYLRTFDDLYIQLRYPLMFIMASELTLTWLLAFCLMQSVAIDKDTSNILFISYMGYLGLNGLFAFWILWTFGETGSITDFYGYLTKNPYYVFIASIILIILCIPYLYGTRRADTLRKEKLNAQNDRLDKMIGLLSSQDKEPNLFEIEMMLKEALSEETTKRPLTSCLDFNKKPDLWQLHPQLGLEEFINKSKKWIKEHIDHNLEPKKFSMDTDKFVQDLHNQKDELAVVEDQSKQMKFRSWAGFVNVFSLFLGPALSSLAANAGLSIGSDAFAKLVSNVMGNFL